MARNCIGEGSALAWCPQAACHYTRTNIDPDLCRHRASAGPHELIIANLSIYRKTSNISRTLAGNKIIDNSDVVGASPVGAAPTTSSFST